MAQLSAEADRQRPSSFFANIESTYATVAEWCIYLIGFAVPLTYLPMSAEIYGIPKVTMFRVLSIIMFTALALRAVHVRRISIPRTPIDLPILAFVVIAFISSFQGISWSAAIFGADVRSDGLLTFINVVLLGYVTIALLRDTTKIKRALFGISLASFLISIEGVLEYFNFSFIGQPADYFGFRVFSTLGNPDFLGGYLVMTVPITVGLLIMSESRRARIFWGVNLFVSFAAIFFTYTRGAWISLVCVGLVYAVFQRKIIWSNKWWFGGLAVFMLLVVVSADSGWLIPLRHTNPPVASPSVQSANATETENESSQQANVTENATQAAGVAGVANTTEDAAMKEKQARLSAVESANSSVSGADRLKSIVNPEKGGAGRLWIWESALGAIKDHPIIGTGWDSSYAVLTKYYTMDWVRSWPNLWIDKVHNELLEIAVHTGLVGLAVYLWMLVAFALAVIKGFSKRGWTNDQLLVAAAFSFLGYMAQVMFLFGTVDTMPIFWITIGICLGIVLERKERVLDFSLPLGFLAQAGVYVVVLIGAVFLLYSSAMVQISEIYLFNAMQAGQRHDANSSLMYYLKAVEYAPTSEDTLVQAASNLGQFALFTPDLRQRSHLLNESILLWNKVIDSHPQFAQLYQLRAETYALYETDHVMDAHNDFKRAVELYPLYGRALGGIADTSHKMGLLPEAIIAERQLATINPKNVVVLQSLAQDYFTMGRWKDAIATWQKVAELKGDSAGLRYWTAQAYFRSGNRDRAVEELRNGVQAWPDDTQLRTGLEQLTGNGSDN